MSAYVEDRIWGTIHIDDPLIEELIQSPEIQRLKRIAQAGITAYIESERDTTRFDHSIGVYYLLKKFGSTREELVAGLIHDFTHTAFSHVIDYVYVNASQSYHEDEFVKKYKQSSLYGIIKKHGINPELFTDLEKFSILEQPIPNLCADRLDYFIRDYYISTKNNTNIFLWVNSLNVNSGRLVFSDTKSAESFGISFLNEMETTWFSPRGVYCYSMFAQLLGKALQNNVITPTNFETDDQTVIRILHTQMKNEYTSFLTNSKKNIKVVPNKIGEAYPYIGKFRYIDPFVGINGKITQLSSFNRQFAKKIVSLKETYSLSSIPGNDSPGYKQNINNGPFTIAAPVKASVLTAVQPFVITADTKAKWTAANAANSGNLVNGPANAEFDITLDGVTDTITVNLSAAGTLAAVATAMQVAINASGVLTSDADVDYNVTTSSRFTVKSKAYGVLGSVDLASTSGLGTDIFADLGGTGTGETSAGVDGTNRVKISNVVSGGSPTVGTVELAAGGAVSASSLASDLTTKFATAGITSGMMTFTVVGTKVKIEHAEAGTDDTFQLQTVSGSAYTALGIGAGNLNTTKAGSFGTDRLSIDIVNDAVSSPVVVTLTAGVRSISQIVDEVAAAVGSNGTVELISSNAGDFMRVSSIGLGSDSSVEFIDADPSTDSTALTLLGISNTINTGTDGDDTLTFAERYYGDTGISVRLSKGTAYDSNDPVYKVEVFQGDLLVSKYDNVRKTAATVAEEEMLFANVIGTDSNPIDPYITVEDLGSLATITLSADTLAGTIAGDTYVLAPNTADPSGFVLSIDDSEILGSSIGSKTGLEIFADKETIDLTLLAVPGHSSDAVIHRLIDIAEARGDLLALIDPPYGLTVQQVGDWHNAQGSYALNRTALNSSYAALYYPWVKIHDGISGQDIWTAPSGHAAAVIAYTDQVTEPWFAPAGTNRGAVPAAIALEVNVSQGDRDFLQGNLNRVNTFVNFVREGIFLYSQKTLLRKSSQLANINVRRMLLVARKAIVSAVKSLVFEPNDPGTWAAFEALVNPFLRSIANRRGLAEFKVMMNESTVTPDLRDRNEARGILFLKPTTTAEKILVDFVLTSQGASFSELEQLLF